MEIGEARRAGAVVFDGDSGLTGLTVLGRGVDDMESDAVGCGGAGEARGEVGVGLAGLGALGVLKNVAPENAKKGFGAEAGGGGVALVDDLEVNAGGPKSGIDLLGEKVGGKRDGLVAAGEEVETTLAGLGEVGESLTEGGRGNIGVVLGVEFGLVEGVAKSVTLIVVILDKVFAGELEVGGVGDGDNDGFF